MTAHSSASAAHACCIERQPITNKTKGTVEHSSASSTHACYTDRVDHDKNKTNKRNMAATFGSCCTCLL